jgi:2,4-dienoyl-CoA reductase-like NADH-dependent reductase (Old Yellow Enzyme family)
VTTVQTAPAQTGAFFVEKPSLFTPGKIGPLTLKNRVLMASMTTRTADKDGFVTEDSIAYYAARASGGVGLITVEMAAPERAGKHRHFELGISDDKFVPGLRKLVDAIHDAGSKAGIQLGHGGGHTRVDVSGEAPIAPSAIPHVVRVRRCRRARATGRLRYGRDPRCARLSHLSVSHPAGKPAY